jgi:hypothetical protein
MRFAFGESLDLKYISVSVGRSRINREDADLAVPFLCRPSIELDDRDPLRPDAVARHHTDRSDAVGLGGVALHAGRHLGGAFRPFRRCVERKQQARGQKKMG